MAEKKAMRLALDLAEKRLSEFKTQSGGLLTQPKSGPQNNGGQEQTAAKRIADLERELTEQAKCNGMGSEREASLMAKVERLERELAASQATIQRKDEALRFYDSPHSIRWKAREALAIPADRTALDAILAEAETRGMLTGIKDSLGHVNHATNQSEAVARLEHLLRQAAGGE